MTRIHFRSDFQIDPLTKKILERFGPDRRWRWLFLLLRRHENRNESANEIGRPLRQPHFDTSLSTVSLRRLGSRSPCLAMSMMSLAIIITAGSVVTLVSPKACKVGSNAAAIAVMSSGPNTPPCWDSRTALIAT